MALDAGRCAEGLKSIFLSTSLQEDPTIAPLLAMVIPTRYLLQGLAWGGAPNLQTISLSNVFVEPHSPIFVALGKGTHPFLKNMWPLPLSALQTLDLGDNAHLGIQG